MCHPAKSPCSHLSSGVQEVQTAPQVGPHLLRERDQAELFPVGDDTRRDGRRRHGAAAVRRLPGRAAQADVGARVVPRRRVHVELRRPDQRGRLPLVVPRPLPQARAVGRPQAERAVPQPLGRRRDAAAGAEGEGGEGAPRVHPARRRAPRAAAGGHGRAPAGGDDLEEGAQVGGGEPGHGVHAPRLRADPAQGVAARHHQRARDAEVREERPLPAQQPRHQQRAHLRRRADDARDAAAAVAAAPRQPAVRPVAAVGALVTRVRVARAQQPAERAREQLEREHARAAAAAAATQELPRGAPRRFADATWRCQHAAHQDTETTTPRDAGAEFAAAATGDGQPRAAGGGGQQGRACVQRGALGPRRRQRQSRPDQPRYRQYPQWRVGDDVAEAQETADDQRQRREAVVEDRAHRDGGGRRRRVDRGANDGGGAATARGRRARGGRLRPDRQRGDCRRGDAAGGDRPGGTRAGGCARGGRSGGGRSGGGHSGGGRSGGGRSG